MKPTFHFSGGKPLVKLIHFPTRKPLAALGQSFALRAEATQEIKLCLLALIADPPANANMTQFHDHMFIDGDAVVFIVPEWMLLDGVSIPRFFWRVVCDPFEGAMLAPAGGHDLGCYLAQMLPRGPHRKAVRRFSDDLLPQTMRVMKNGRAKCSVVHKGVRIGGIYSANSPQLAELPIWDGSTVLKGMHKNLLTK